MTYCPYCPDIKEFLERYCINTFNDETSKANLPVYRPVTSIATGPFVSEDATSALAVGMKVNNCRDMPTQGKDFFYHIFNLNSKLLP